MSQTWVYNVLVLVGILVGDAAAPRPGGVLLGAAAGMVAAALVSERFGPARRPTDGFWLRHRGEFLGGVGGIAGILFIPQMLPSWPMWIAIAGGWVVGFWLADGLASQMGWSGERLAAELDARGAYVAVLASAAHADGGVSPKERAAVLAAAKRVMADVGYGEACDADAALARAESNPCNPADAAGYASQLAPPLQQALLADLLSVLYSGCRGPGTPGEANGRWLDVFRQTAQIADWSLLAQIIHAAP